MQPIENAYDSAALRAVVIASGLSLAALLGVMQATSAAVLAVAILHVIVLSAMPAAGLMLLTTGRYIYFIGLLVALGRHGGTGYTAGYFAAVDILTLLGAYVAKRGRSTWIVHYPTVWMSVLLFTAATLISWMASGYPPAGLYWMGTYVAFGLLPLAATLALTPEQVNSACMWMCWSVIVLACFYGYQAVTHQLEWFAGRASIEVRSVSVVGSLFIGSVIPLGLYAVAFVWRAGLPGTAARLASPAVRIALVVGLFYMLLFTGERSPLVGLVGSTCLYLLLTRRLSIARKAGIVMGGVSLFSLVYFVPNVRRYMVFSRAAQGEIGTALTEDESAAMRLEYYQIALETFAGSPFIGTGPGTFYSAASKHNLTADSHHNGAEDLTPHNAFLEVAASDGLTGLLPMLFLIYSTMVVVLKSLRDDHNTPQSKTRLLSFLFVTWLYDLILIGLTGSLFADSVFWFCTGAIWVVSSTPELSPSTYRVGGSLVKRDYPETSIDAVIGPS